VPDPFEAAARDVLDELDLNWEYDENAIPKVAQALRRERNRTVEACAAALRDIPTTTLARFARNNWSAVELTKHLAELLLKDLKVSDGE
jgi:hypothetical protein